MHYLRIVGTLLATLPVAHDSLVDKPTEPTPGGSPPVAAATTDVSFLSFTSDRDGDFDIYTINPDGTAEANLTNNTLLDVNTDWSPDRTKVAFESQPDGPPNYEITVMTTDGRRTRLTNNSGADLFPRWPPNGSKIAFRRSPTGPGGVADIYIMNANGTAQTNLTHSPSDEMSRMWVSMLNDRPLTVVDIGEPEGMKSSAPTILDSSPDRWTVPHW
jgi:dipeptidyl aminopeptidase/acylaminoacyl peptidase